MAIQINNMIVTHIALDGTYEIQYEGNTYVVDRSLFHTIYDKHSTSQCYRILKEMFSDDNYLKGTNKIRKDTSKPKEDEISFWLNLIKTDLKISSDNTKPFPPPKMPNGEKRVRIGGGFCME